MSELKESYTIQDLENISIYGARENNLQDIDVEIPRNKLVVITGISGSGKSSLAFDTIYAEGQRRYMESFSAYARQFIGSMEAPDVDKIEGLSPVISIEQKTTNKNPRSTVGTVTEVYDFMRLLYARVGEAFSYVTGKKMVRYTDQELVDHILAKYDGKKVLILAPLVRGRKGHYRELFEQLRKQGFLKIRIDGEVVDIEPKMQIDRYKIHDIEAITDRLKIDQDDRARLAKSIASGMKMGNGLIMIMDHETNETTVFSNQLMCPDSGVSYEEPSPNTFSFNSPYGACPHCNGMGVIKEVSEELIIPDYSKSINEGGLAPLGEYKDTYTFKYVRAIADTYGFSFAEPLKKFSEKAIHTIMYGLAEGEKLKVPVKFGANNRQVYDLEFEGLVNMLHRYYNETSSDSIRKWAEDFMVQNECSECRGHRLRKESLHFKVAEKNIADLVKLDLDQLYEWFEEVEVKLSDRQKLIGKEVLKEIKERLGFLLDVGLNYLTLDRATRTLSGGESQRIRLATQIGSQLQGVTYILDEPSIGLHQRDNEKLIGTLQDLVKIGNSVLVVEHDKEIMLQSDYIIDIGPNAGNYGGKIVAKGTPSEILKSNSKTVDHLSGASDIEIPEKRRTGTGKILSLEGATGNNLKEVKADFPLGVMICVTGVSGSGKSSLVNETLYPILNHHFFRAKKKPLPYKKITGLEYVDKVIEIDQSPIGRTPRSNPATYIGVFTDIRQLYANLPEAKIRGYKPGRFSFNVKGGRCETCEGGGMRVVEMNFLPDVYIECETCLGKRYNRETLEVRYKGKSISDVLDMSIAEGVEFFSEIPSIYRKLKTLLDVGLGYITLGQSATTISGGEAQRVKLASELSKKDTGNTFYILDEPTTGLHFEDIKKLLEVLNKLVDKGNTVLIIEHNLDVVKVADHIIDIGPEGGSGGGTIVAKGTPEEVSKSKQGHTARFLRDELKL